MPEIRFSNASALGLFRVSWTSPNGAACEAVWEPGMTGPQVSMTLSNDRTSPLMPIVAPERFGWKPPKKAADFIAFLQRFTAVLYQPDPDEETIYRAGLCATCRTPLMQLPSPFSEEADLVWDHAESGHPHPPRVLDGSVTTADVWDFDEAAAGRYGNA